MVDRRRDKMKPPESVQAMAIKGLGGLSGIPKSMIMRREVLRPRRARDLMSMHALRGLRHICQLGNTFAEFGWFPHNLANGR
jgi:hypothetical protein